MNEVRRLPVADSAPEPACYRVGDLCVLPGIQRVLREGREIALPRLSFNLLRALIRAAPNTLSVDELMDRVWPGLVVSPETVTQRIKLLRDALSDDSHAPRYIGLVRGRGYRLLLPAFPGRERRQTGGGSLQRIGDRVRINVQLIDAASEVHRWAQTYDFELTAANLLDIQAEITRAIAAALQGTLATRAGAASGRAAPRSCAQRTLPD